MTAKAKTAKTPKKHIETASERLARLTTERLAMLLATPVAEDEKLYPFTSPIGMDWQLRRADITAFVQAGGLPLSLIERMLRGQANGQSIEDTLKTLSPSEQAANIAFTRMLACYCAVNPRIVETPANENEVAYVAVPGPDFSAIAAWAMSHAGGDEAKGLENFPRE